MAESAMDDFENISLSDGTASDLEDDGNPGNSVEEQLDPRVQEELECLNSASEEINKLEIELEQARSKFRQLLNESSQKMNTVYKKLGRCVNKARPFYELQKEARKEQAEAQRAVVKFQRANSIYQAARETVALAEERLKDLDDGEKREFDSAWQEMMNHATMKFMESEKEKTRSEQEHLKRAGLCAEMQTRLKFLEKDMPRSISKARPYFEMKDLLELRLQQEKLNVEDLQRALNSSKLQYKGALAELESISNEVHERRKLYKSLPPRTPGVGAELNNDSADLPSINLDVISETSSIISDDQISTDSFTINGSSSSEGTASILVKGSRLAHSNHGNSISSPTPSTSSSQDKLESPLSKSGPSQGLSLSACQGHDALSNNSTLTETPPFINSIRAVEGGDESSTGTAARIPTESSTNGSGAKLQSYLQNSEIIHLHKGERSEIPSHTPTGTCTLETSRDVTVPQLPTLANAQSGNQSNSAPRDIVIEQDNGERNQEENL